MDFELTAEQEALQSGLRKQLAGRAPMERVRAAADKPGAVDAELWAELEAAGVFNLRIDPSHGGVGLGMADAVLVFEELGRALVTGPLVASHVLAGAVGGVVTVAERDQSPVLIEHLDAADTVVVFDQDGAWRLDPAEVEAEPVGRPLDPLTPLHRLPAIAPGARLGDPTTASRWRREGAALVAGQLLGIAEATTDLAVAYAMERHQFDRPIGSFQAVKHILADMLVRTEVARAAVYAAGVVLDDPGSGDAARAVAVAKVQAGEAAVANGKACIQVHGGMGFTWEVDAHLYLKRAWVLDTQFGSATNFAEQLAWLL